MMFEGQYHFDDHGNPIGRAYDLGGVDDEQLRGEKILLYVAYTKESYEWEAAQAAVSERQMQMDIVFARHGRCPLSSHSLEEYSQLWIVSDWKQTMSKHQVNLVCEFVRNGGGLLLWADNDPYYQDANAIAKVIIGTKFSGDQPGEGVMQPSKHLKPGHFIEHPLTQGVNSLFEGHTICTIAPAPHLTLLAQSHDGQICTACYEYEDQRIVLDSAFTKLAPGNFEKTAGTSRYFRNIAFWLSRGARGVEYTSFTPGRETLATINPGGISERYQYAVSEASTLSYMLHWEGAATLGLAVQDPEGHIHSDSCSHLSPLRVDIQRPVAGTWTCWVKGINVPRSEFPYVLTLAKKDVETVIPVASVAARQINQSISDAGPGVDTYLSVYLVVDNAAHAREYVSALANGIDYLVDQLKQRPTRGAQAKLELILTDTSTRLPPPRSDIPPVRPTIVLGHGTCALGHALNTLLTHLSLDKTNSKPLVVILLAGAPEDEWLVPADQLRALALQGKVNILAIGLKHDVSLAVLKRLTSSRPLTITHLTQDQSKQVFAWLFGLADVALSNQESNTDDRPTKVPIRPSCLRFVE